MYTQEALAKYDQIKSKISKNSITPQTNKKFSQEFKIG
jgi:hypothetical protein